MLEIITFPNQILRSKCAPLTNKQILSDEYQNLIKEMILTMDENKGVGLAAPQIGRNIQLLVISTEDGPVVLINPEIIKFSLLKEIEEEGCLSIPKTFCNVKRSKSVRIKALNNHGQPVEFSAKGLFARVIQHEVDHLAGVLITDKNIKK